MTHEQTEIERLTQERDEARAEVEQMHARADHATAELLALGRELKQAREERDEERHTYELLADHIEKLLPVPDDDVAEVALLMTAIDDVVKERDQARRLVEYRDAELHKRWNQMAEMELLRDKLRADVTSAVAEGAALRVSLSTALCGYSDLLDAAEPIDEAMSGRYTEEYARISKGCEAILDDSTLAAHVTALLTASLEWRRWGDSALSRLATAVDAYRATLHDTT